MRCRICKRNRPSMIEECPDYLENHGAHVKDIAAFCRSLNDWCLECFKGSDKEKEIDRNIKASNYSNWIYRKW